ncbi:MAG TPA: hypothetical protein ENH62_16580 [Marinobacter sp.]|uniref:Uncharacterized protein n=1 Tax=marine sediment metagenome TaxID=412755 RepID=A0A0F9NGY6_9ZZZZ|nr:hypothetical protein [Marinobacter sp.]
MNDEQVNAYMQELLSGKRKVEGLLEGKALEHFRNATTQIAQGRERTQQLSSEVEQIRNAVQQLIGQQTAYSQLLVAAETARRSEKKDSPPDEPGSGDDTISLVTLRDRVGADRVDAIDNDGNLVDSSEASEASEGEESSDTPTSPMPPKPKPRFIKEGEEGKPCQK